MAFSPRTLGAPSKFRLWHPQQLDGLFRFQSFVADPRLRFLAMVLPTGAGKSLLAWSFAAMTGLRTLVLTANRYLEKQYVEDFEGHHLTDIQGQQNYKCLALEPGGILQRYSGGVRGQMCDQGPCHQGVYCKLMQGGCVYYDKLREAAAEDLTVCSNYSKWISHGKALRSGRVEEEPIGSFDVLVCDEAHEAAAQVTKALTVSLWEDELRRFASASLPAQSAEAQDWAVWAQKQIPFMEEMLTEFHREVSKIGLTGATTESMRALKRLLEALDQLAGMDGDWVLTRDGKRVVAEAVSPKRHCEGLLYREIEKVVLMGATLTEKDVEELGAGGNR